MKYTKKHIEIVSMFLLLIVFNTMAVFWDYLTSPIGGKEQVVFIKTGWCFKDVVHVLEERNIITHPLLFHLWGELKGIAKHIKTGEYLITPKLTPNDLLERLAAGKGIILYKITIPEGSTVRQIADMLEKSGVLCKERFIKLACDQKFIKRLNLNVDVLSLEGYLFPTTYFFPRGIKEEYIIKAMVEQFKLIYKKYSSKAEKMGLSFSNVVTLASIVEKETAFSEEKPIIASVFLNRLKLNMPLQCDPTVIYALPNFNGNLTKADLFYPSPYNTYLYKGLPPTPICNPGEEALAAVVDVPKTPFLYFVSKNNGEHHFSKTLAEHEAAVTRYQRN